YTDSISQGVRRPVRADGLTLHLRESWKDMYIPCTMTTNSHEWDKAWFYLHNDDERPPAYTGKVLVEKRMPGITGCEPPSTRPSSRCTPTRCVVWRARG